MAEEVRRIEHEAGPNQQERAETDRILGREIRIEGHAVLRPLDLDSVRVVRSRHMQRGHMQHDDADDDEGQQIVQRVEAVQGRVIDTEATP